MTQTQPLDYQTPQTIDSEPRLLWIVTLLLGIVQFPWVLYWMFKILDTHNGQPVRLVQDSPYYIIQLALTFPALGTGACCLYQARRTRHLRVLLSGAVVVALSMLLLAWVVNAWYSDVYLYRNGNYGLW
jgi:hypothetical protein